MKTFAHTHVNAGVSISKFLLRGRMAANKISNNFDCGSMAATPNITPVYVGPPNVTPNHP